MKNNFFFFRIAKLLVIVLFFISESSFSQGCAGGSICNWSGGPYRYPNGSSTPITLGCITTNGGGSSWVSYGPSWGGPGTPVLVFTAVAGQDYTFTLDGGQATGSNYLINIHSGNTPGAGACIKTATARFGGSPWATSCTINVTAAELVAGNDYIVQFAECGETAGSCVSVYRFGTTPDEFINITYGQTGATPPAQPNAITPSTSICVGSSQTYCTNNVGGVTYTWSVTSGGTITGGQGTNCITINWTSTGVQTMTVVPSSGGCTGTARTRSITVNTVPAAVSVNTSGTYCGSTTLTATGGTTRYWQGTISGGTSTATPSSSQIVTVSGTYYFRANNACGWGTEGSATVTINPYPSVNAIGGGAPSVMVGNTTPAFTNSTPGGTWSITNGTGSATINASGVATGVSTGTVTVNYSVTVNGCTTVVTTVLTITAFIPIELMEFSAACVDEKVILIWRTALERNNDFYTIEKSFDASLWEEIGFVDGAGTTSSVNHYEFIDETAARISDLASNSFYRLKQTDFDGQAGYFGPLSVTCFSSDEWNLFLINPADDELVGTFYSDEDAEVVFNIIDLRGRIIYEEKISVVKGSNLLRMDITTLVNGFYFIKAHNEKKNILRKFVR